MLTSFLRSHPPQVTLLLIYFIVKSIINTPASPISMVGFKQRIGGNKVGCGNFEDEAVPKFFDCDEYNNIINFIIQLAIYSFDCSYIMHFSKCFFMINHNTNSFRLCPTRMCWILFLVKGTRHVGQDHVYLLIQQTTSAVSQALNNFNKHASDIIIDL